MNIAAGAGTRASVDARVLRLQAKAADAGSVDPQLATMRLARARDEDALIEIAAAGVNPSDVKAAMGMPDGGRLTIETATAHLDDAYAKAKEDVTPGQYTSIAITDTGAGIAPDIVGKIFEPFFTTKPAGHGR